jgi:translation initiation factor 1
MPFTIAGEWIPEEKPKQLPTRPVKIVKEKRGQSIVTLILNLPLEAEKIKGLCSKLKQRLGCGGSVKDGKIELQGDKVQLIKDFLKQEKIKAS